MKMKLKSSVRIEGVAPEIAFIMPAIAKVFSDIDADLVITSVTDGVHMAGSLHNVGKAIDVRSRDLGVPQRQAIVQQLKKALGPSFDVVAESSHIHIELDP